MRHSKHDLPPAYDIALAGHLWMDGNELPTSARLAVSMIEKTLKIDTIAAYILLTIYAGWDRKDHVDDRSLLLSLTTNAIPNPTDALERLKMFLRRGWIEVTRVTRNCGKDYAPSPGMLAFFSTGDSRFLDHCIAHQGDPLLNECISWQEGSSGRDYDSRAGAILNALVEHRESPLVRHINRFEQNVFHQSVILYLLGYEITESAPCPIEHIVDRLIPSRMSRYIERNVWRRSDAPAYSNGIIEPREIVNGNVESVGLSAAFLKRFLPKSLRPHASKKTEIPKSDYFVVLRPDQIPMVKLRYNASFQFELDTFLGLLSPQRLDAYFDLLRKRSMTPALSVMLSGAPGTGKTELVRQLARKHKRVLIQVNLQGLREMWFGESEKNVTRLFSEIQAVRKNLSK